MKELFELYYIFAKIGLFTFGGGYAMLPVISRELIDRRGWLTEAELLDYYAAAQCTPGVIAVNTATFTGMKRRGLPGSIFATLGVITPSFIIILLLASFISRFADNAAVAHALSGIRITVCALVGVSLVKMFRRSVVDIVTLLIFIAALAVTVAFGINPVFTVAGAAFAGAVASAVRRKHKAKTDKQPEK